MEDVFEEMSEQVDEIEDMIRTMKGRRSPRRDQERDDQASNDPVEPSRSTDTGDRAGPETPGNNKQEEDEPKDELWLDVTETDSSYPGFDDGEDDAPVEAPDERPGTREKTGDQHNHGPDHTDTKRDGERTHGTADRNTGPGSSSSPAEQGPGDEDSPDEGKDELTEELRAAVQKARNGAVDDARRLYQELVLDLRKLVADGKLTDEQHELFQELRDKVDTSV